MVPCLQTSFIPVSNFPPSIKISFKFDRMASMASIQIVALQQATVWANYGLV